MTSESKVPGASNNERLLGAARSDNQELLLEIFKEGNFDINFQDGLGYTALHWAVKNGATDVLEHILSHEDCDVDPINRLEKETPLHLGVKLEDQELRLHVVESLLDAGADTRIKDKHGETALDIMPPDDTELSALVGKFQAQASISLDDVASDDGSDAGSESGSEE